MSWNLSYLRIRRRTTRALGEVIWIENGSHEWWCTYTAVTVVELNGVCIRAGFVAIPRYFVIRVRVRRQLAKERDLICHV